MHPASFPFTGLFTVLLCMAAGTTAAQAPAAGFDPARLTRDNFYQVLEPVAKREGRLVLYNFAGNFDPVWKNGLIPRFEARYGVKVAYHNVRKDQANQQLMAVHKAGAPSPVDVYFAGGPDNYKALQTAGVIAGFNLARLLPNLSKVPEGYKDVVLGVDTRGTWPLVHRSQMVLGYDSARLAPAAVPRSFEALLAWAEQHPRQFAITAPAKGGSGGGLLYAAAMHLVADASCRSTLVNVHLTEEEAARWANDAACLQPLWSYLTRLVKASEMTNGNADTLNLLNNQQVLLGTTWEDLALTFVRGGQLPSTFRPALLEKGLVASGDGLIATAHARSPAAALLFIDMAFGREFQAWKLEHHASRSPRPDVQANAISADTARYLVPEAQAAALSVPANWIVTRGLVRAFEDKVLSRL